MKSVITGADDTPYADGIFIFDIFFPENYPFIPPNITLTTTGEGDIRFSNQIN
jgi:ubiquitin-protein ligase